MEERIAETEPGAGEDSPPVALAEAMRSDQPCVHPEKDKFGFMPTARIIARTIQNAPAPNGLVLHIDGEWRSGKSSMLGLIQHVLMSDAALVEKPVQSIWFNPWWFSDHEHLAQQFLGAFSQQLLHESKALAAAGKLIAKYSDALSGVVVAAAASMGFPLPGAAQKGIAAYFRLLVRTQKDVPQLKREIAAKLLEAGQRFVVYIDDVDRLTPAEINQVLRVVKAVADFPNVVFVLAFDRNEVARALHAELQVNGSAYLEKIVQVPFVLPTLRPDVLRDLLIEDVRQSAPEVRFEPSPDQYEANVLIARAHPACQAVLRHLAVPNDGVRAKALDRGQEGAALAPRFEFAGVELQWGREEAKGVCLAGLRTDDTRDLEDAHHFFFTWRQRASNDLCLCPPAIDHGQAEKTPTSQTSVTI